MVTSHHTSCSICDGSRAWPVLSPSDLIWSAAWQKVTRTDSANGLLVIESCCKMTMHMMLVIVMMLTMAIWYVVIVVMLILHVYSMFDKPSYSDSYMMFILYHHFGWFKSCFRAFQPTQKQPPKNKSVWRADHQQPLRAQSIYRWGGTFGERWNPKNTGHRLLQFVFRVNHHVVLKL